MLNDRLSKPALKWCGVEKLNLISELILAADPPSELPRSKSGPLKDYILDSSFDLKNKCETTDYRSCYGSYA